MDRRPHGSGKKVGGNVKMSCATPGAELEERRQSAATSWALEQRAHFRCL